MGIHVEMDLLFLLGTNMSLEKPILKMIFLFPRWDMLIPQRVYLVLTSDPNRWSAF